MRCPRKQGFLCAECHQVSQLSDLGVIGCASTDAQSHSIYPIIHYMNCCVFVGMFEIK
jgi:hypothetical protein